MKSKKGTVAVYLNNDNDWEKIERYLNKASSLGYDEIFSSLHLPEVSFITQMKGIEKLMELASTFQMRTTFDVGGDTLDIIFSNEELVNKIKELKITNLRLDCYYSKQQIEGIVNKLNISGFVLNASTLQEEELIDNLSMIRNVLPTAIITSCHNFYIRAESGISVEYMMKQNALFKKYELEITACLPSLNEPRGPLFIGLPTLEKHRECDLSEAALELYYLCGNDRIMIGDGFASDKELEIISDIFGNKPLEIEIKTVVNDPIVKEKLFSTTHYLRPDNGVNAYRLESSRKMALPGSLIQPNNQVERKVNSITIDNKLYQRYSGEIQIVFNQMPADQRVNVIGEVINANKLKYLTKGLKFIFKENNNGN